MRTSLLALATLALVPFSALAQTKPAPLVIISLDGMRHDYITKDADAAQLHHLAGSIVTDAPGTGTHGYLPSRPDLRSAFMIKGTGIAKGRDLHVIDMRQIAPTFAGLLNIKLPDAKLQPVNVKP